MTLLRMLCILFIVLFSSISTAQIVDSFQFRLKGINLNPFAKSEPLTSIGGHVNKAHSDTVAAIDLTAFFTDRWAAELVLTNTRHKIAATGTTLGTVDLGKISFFPPILTLQYHHPINEMVVPYIGVGLNYTIFYRVDLGPTATAISYKNSLGPAYQFGTDFYVNEHWLFNFDVKKISIRTDTKITINGLPANSKVELDSFVIGLGIGYKF